MRTQQSDGTAVGSLQAHPHGRRDQSCIREPALGTGLEEVGHGYLQSVGDSPQHVERHVDLAALEAPEEVRAEIRARGEAPLRETGRAAETLDRAADGEAKGVHGRAL